MSSKKWRAEHPEYDKEYYLKHREQIGERNKKYHLAYPEKKKEADTKWRAANQKHLKEYWKKYFATHIEKRRLNGREYVKTHKKETRLYYAENKEQINKQSRGYRLAHLEQTKEDNKKYFQTPKGKEIRRKNRAARKGFGFVPLNKSFDGSRGHHVDAERVIYIPVEMHIKNPHSVLRNRGMERINTLAWNFLNKQETQNANQNQNQ